MVLEMHEGGIKAVRGPGLDKLNVALVGTRGKVAFRPDFLRAWSDEGNDKLFKVTRGGMYEKTGDLRCIRGMDARLSVGHRHHEKLGPKLEIFKVGEKTISDIVGIIEEIWAGDVWESELLRVDLTADTAGVRVGEFERSMYVAHKQTRQTEYGKAADVEVDRMYGRRAGETLYFGRGAGQVRIYDKTEHRKFLLMELNKQRRKRNEPTKTFIEEWGYDPIEIRTRVEKQCSDRMSEALWGVGKLGQIHRLADVDPFENFRFAADGKGERELTDLEPMMRTYILLLRERTVATSIAQTRSFVQGNYPDSPRAFRKFWQAYQHLITPHSAQLSKAHLTRQFRESIIAQLAA